MNKRTTLSLVLGTGFCLLASAALAAAKGGSDAGNGLGGSDEVILAVQVMLLLFVGRGLGELMQRAGQPAVIGNLLAGLILGPSLFGWVWPQAHHLIFPSDPKIKSLITGISDMGVMMLLLLTGMETDLKLVRKVGFPAIAPDPSACPWETWATWMPPAWELGLPAAPFGPPWLPPCGPPCWPPPLALASADC